MYDDLNLKTRVLNSVVYPQSITQRRVLDVNDRDLQDRGWHSQYVPSVVLVELRIRSDLTEKSWADPLGDSYRLLSRNPYPVWCYHMGIICDYYREVA
jgi:hypothetical protein